MKCPWNTRLTIEPLHHRPRCSHTRTTIADLVMSLKYLSRRQRVFKSHPNAHSSYLLWSLVWRFRRSPSTRSGGSKCQWCLDGSGIPPIRTLTPPNVRATLVPVLSIAPFSDDHSPFWSAWTLITSFRDPIMRCRDYAACMKSELIISCTLHSSLVSLSTAHRRRRFLSSLLEYECANSHKLDESVNDCIADADIDGLNTELMNMATSTRKEVRTNRIVRLPEVGCDGDRRDVCHRYIIRAGP